jgi:hypothetical protein
VVLLDYLVEIALRMKKNGCRSAADGVSQDFLIGVGSNEATPLSKAA